MPEWACQEVFGPICRIPAFRHQPGVWMRAISTGSDIHMPFGSKTQLVPALGLTPSPCTPVGSKWEGVCPRDSEQVQDDSPGPGTGKLLSWDPQVYGPTPEGKTGKAGPVLPLAAQEGQGRGDTAPPGSGRSQRGSWAFLPCPGPALSSETGLASSHPELSTISLVFFQFMLLPLG